LYLIISSIDMDSLWYPSLGSSTSATAKLRGFWLLSLSLWRWRRETLLSYSLRSQISVTFRFVCSMLFQFTSLFPLILIQEFNLFILLFVYFL